MTIQQEIVLYNLSFQSYDNDLRQIIFYKLFMLLNYLYSINIYLNSKINKYINKFL